MVGALKSLQLSIVERAGSTSVRYKKLVVVANAPALFVIPCGEPSCEDGGHDLTSEILAALRSRATHFEGDSKCRGASGSANCTRELHYSAIAEFDPSAS